MFGNINADGTGQAWDYMDGGAPVTPNLSLSPLSRWFKVNSTTTLASEGIFIYNGDFSVAVSVGDRVVVTRTVDQYFAETQPADITQVESSTAGFRSNGIQKSH